MKLKNYAYRCMAVVCAIVAVACVDEDFSFDKVSKEVSVIDGKTTLPIGSLEKQTLGSLLGADTELPEGFVKNEDGSYTFTDRMEPESAGLGDFDLSQLTSFTLERMASEFEVELPSLSFDAPALKVDAQTPINTDIAPVQSFLDQVRACGVQVDTNEGTIPEDIDVLLQYLWPDFEWPSFETSYSETYNDKFTFDVPEQIAGVNKIYFERVEENGPDGAPFRLSVALNGLAGISNGGDVLIKLSMPDNVTFKTNKGDNSVSSYSETIHVEPGESNIDFEIYFEYIDASAVEVVDGKFDMELGMTCEIGFKFGTKAGYYNLNQKPTIELYSEFKLKDAEVEFANNATIMDFELEEPFDIQIPNLPEQIKSINRIDLTDDTALNIFINGFDALKESGEYIAIDMTLPDFIEFNVPADARYSYDAENHKITTSLAAISDGLEIGFDAIDFGEGYAPVNGEVALTYQPEIKVYFDSAQTVNIMSFLPVDEATGEPIRKLDIEAGLDETVVGLESVSANIDLGDMGNINKSISLEDLQELNELPIAIEGSGLSPVIVIEIVNPITLAPEIHAAITPVSGDVRDEENKFAFDAQIKAAQYVDGEVVPATTKLVLGKSNRAAEYPAEEGYSFHAFDNIESLIKTPVPESIDLSASVVLPNDGLVELHVSDSLDIKFGYSIEMPLAFDNTLGISYEDKVSILDNGKSPLADVAETEGIKVGDVAIIAEFETTLPLELEVTTTLYDKEGNELPTKIGLTEGGNIVKGSADGVTPEKSTLRLQFNLADENGSLKELADIADVGFKIAARCSAADGVVAALRDEQYIAAELKLEIDGGITVDLAEVI
ncbi:MAG: hypothetical protein IKY51_03790 [Alistipes sp.]|nr:hypothetical protein [Alistipes sp.]